MTIRSQLADLPGGIFFLGGFPNDEALIKGYPLVGSDGHLMSRALRAAGLTDPTDPPRGYLGVPLAETRRTLWERRAHSFSTVLDYQPDGMDLHRICAPLREEPPWYGISLPSIKDGGCLRPEQYPQILRLIRELCACRPNIVVSLGDLALWSLTGENSTEAWRGAPRSVPERAPIMMLATQSESSFLRSLKIFPTFPPERVFQQYRLLSVLIADLMKVKHEAAFPEIRPLEVTVWLEPTLGDLATFYTLHIEGADVLTIDIETAVGQIVCVQIGTSPTCALVLPFVDYRKPSRSYWATEAEELAAWRWLGLVLDTVTPKLGQNFSAYDAFWLLDKAGLSVRNLCHDLRLAFHILQPELPKSLAFIGAMFTQMPRWKTNVHHGGTDEKRDS